jgi:hypothetical protein|tara:strand:+ start:6333 stop:7298 length:966 start_codon:yes stop_codon:yes gene_type:complete
MGSKTVYNPPKIEKDDSFAKYLEYQQGKEDRLQAQADKEKAETKAKDLTRRKSGAQGLTGLYDRTKSQLESGLLSFQGAQDKLQGYIDKYDLTSGFTEDEGFTPTYTDPNKGAGQYLTNLQDAYQGQGGLLEKQRTSGVNLAYQDILGRQATADELSGAMSNLQLQSYGGAGISGLRDSLKSSSEYTKNVNNNYLDNYYDTMYGKQTRDAEGNMTGKRKFTFDPSLLPTYQGDLGERTGVGVTTGEQFSDYFKEGRTIAELEEGKSNIRDSRKFLYSAGLTNLQGEIDKETQKIKNEGTKDIAKIQQEGSIYGQLLGGFNF